MEQCPTTTRKPARLSLGKRLLLIVMLLFAGGLAFGAVPLQSAQASEAQQNAALPRPGGRDGGQGRTGHNRAGQGRASQGRTGHNRTGHNRTGRHRDPGHNRTGRHRDFGHHRHHRRHGYDINRHHRWHHRRWYNNRWYYDYDGSGAYYTCGDGVGDAVVASDAVVVSDDDEG